MYTYALPKLHPWDEKGNKKIDVIIDIKNKIKMHLSFYFKRYVLFNVLEIWTRLRDLLNKKKVLNFRVYEKQDDACSKKKIT